jgi:hypothetical protein
LSNEVRYITVARYEHATGFAGATRSLHSLVDLLFPDIAIA